MIDPHSQEGKILQALKDAGAEGMHPTRFVMDLGILMYTSRINGIRRDFGCTCIHGNMLCTANEHIVNEKYDNHTSKYFYRSNLKTDFEALRQETIRERDAVSPSDQPNLF